MAKLTAKGVAAAKPGRHQDGNGLYLEVSKTGGRRWKLRIQKDGRRRDIGLGSAQDVTLAEAREKAGDIRKAVRRGADPIEARGDKAKVPTFKEAAIQVHAERLPGWKNAKHAAQWLSTLGTYAFPKIGSKLVSEIGSGDMHDVAAAIWLTRPETARRVLQRLGTVLDYAHAKGWRASEAPVRAVRAGLPRNTGGRKHFPAMPWQDVPAFIAEMPRKVQSEEGIRLLLEFLILTASRTGEARGIRWCEVDLDAAVWTIPGNRMKAGKAHRVPLSGRVVDILKHMARFRRWPQETAYIFEGRKSGRPYSDMTLLNAMKRAGYPYAPHGFRSSFRDFAAEATSFPREVAERALAHVIKDKAEAAYARSDLLERRRELMEAWAAHCVPAEGGKVVTLQRA